ncbi:MULTISPECIES: DUF3237 domain-containing protein [unclassified Pseudomonas]|jgi:hypothetical protein|uniref:DUF3237 domain-containing protein n=1 Tax=unclassified Pseudomonas TaxID=196821 RepID=UPI0002722F31|nr:MULTISPECIES: DUF3237 domain-containing protein [unclassified Pseudomonas]EJM21096.1 Protein of unknown function (DUF3237) [Pseudomonas sp. GM21]MBV7477590.1 DUF3237 domain-containing protein [Pseudomonas sp. PDM31]
MSITLTHLATATLKLGTPSYLPNTPRGTRAIVDVLSAQWEGERLNATLKPVAAADWALVTADGTLHIDVRCTLETHDGALIHVSYTGRASVGPEGTSPVMITPTFETGDSRYAWLNKVQAIGRGIKGENDTLIYDIYQAN